jgi:hypothetical protein
MGDQCWSFEKWEARFEAEVSYRFRRQPGCTCEPSNLGTAMLSSSAACTCGTGARRELHKVAVTMNDAELDCTCSEPKHMIADVADLLVLLESPMVAVEWARRSSTSQHRNHWPHALRRGCGRGQGERERRFRGHLSPCCVFS